MTEAFIIGAKRSAIGSFGGALMAVPPAELGTQVASAALADLGPDAKAQVEEVIVGNVLAAGHGMNIARQVCLGAGLSHSTTAYTVNKVCGSGLKSVALAATSVRAGENDLILAGGVESMSQAAFVSLHTRWGARMGNQELLDLMLQDGLRDVFGGCHMGVTAENLAKKFQISRQAQDSYAVESQRRAAAAQAAGLFDGEIAPIRIQSKKGESVFNRDEYIRGDTSLEALAKLRPAFDKEGSVTAGNASGINDGAAFVVVASERKVRELGVQPLARIVGTAVSGVPPEIMGIGPVEAVRRIVSKSGIALSSVDAIEANEAFAVQALAVAGQLELNQERTNAWGGAIALGHPIGASGARVLVTLLSRLKRGNGRYGIATLCIGGGQGIAMMVERV